jgi:DNA-binding Lrp family transcriptional regulator
MILKPQDVLVLLKLLVWRGKSWSYQELAEAVGMSASEVHAGLNRAFAAGLVDVDRKLPVRQALGEFLLHGVKYMCPPERGGATRGMPTGHAAPFVAKVFAAGDEPAPVWPSPVGKVRGVAFEPLYRSAPKAAARDEDLYRLLVLVDLIRGGSAREKSWAASELERTIGSE